MLEVFIKKTQKIEIKDKYGNVIVTVKIPDEAKLTHCFLGLDVPITYRVERTKRTDLPQKSARKKVSA